jgi:excisionase family DNA binding protein
MITLKEISKIYGIHYRTLVREVHRGKLKASRLGKMFVVDEKDFTSYQNGTEVLRSLQVLVALIFKGDEMLIVKRRHAEGSLIWQNPSGLLRLGRNNEDQVKDICLAETNSNVRVNKRIGTRISPDTKVKLIYYHCEYLDGDIINKDNLQNSEIKWIKRTDALKYFTSSVYDRLLEYFV